MTLLIIIAIVAVALYFWPVTLICLILGLSPFLLLFGALGVGSIHVYDKIERCFRRPTPNRKGK